MTNKIPLKGLRRLREQQGATEAEAAQVLGTTQSQYHKLESGGTRLDVHRAKTLADWLKARIEDLL